jgi:hypothetical protein
MRELVQKILLDGLTLYCQFLLTVREFLNKNREWWSWMIVTSKYPTIQLKTLFAAQTRESPCGDRLHTPSSTFQSSQIWSKHENNYVMLLEYKVQQNDGNYVVSKHVVQDPVVEKVPYQFAGIIYNCGNVEEELVLEPEYYVENNEILSNVFIRHWLRENGLKYSDEYQITLMDHLGEIKYLNSDSFILLKKTNYEIVVNKT